MPNWKKVVVSGSDASLNSLTAPSITGFLYGTASFALNSFATYGNQGLPKRFIEPADTYYIRPGLQSYTYDMYNFGTLEIDGPTITMPLGSGSISSPGSMIVNELYNAGTINNSGIIQISDLRNLS